VRLRVGRRCSIAVAPSNPGSRRDAGFRPAPTSARSKPTPTAAKTRGLAALIVYTNGFGPRHGLDSSVHVALLLLRAAGRLAPRLHQGAGAFALPRLTEGRPRAHLLIASFDLKGYKLCGGTRSMRAARFRRLRRGSQTDLVRRAGRPLRLKHQ